MNLKQFKEHIESSPSGTVFQYGISEPFSWRGVYSQVAFEVLDSPMSREGILEVINEAYTKTFTGYKGGSFTYDDDTPVNFENDRGSWTDGDYTARWIAKLDQSEYYRSQEERLVKLAFRLS